MTMPLFIAKPAKVQSFALRMFTAPIQQTNTASRMQNPISLRCITTGSATSRGSVIQTPTINFMVLRRLRQWTRVCCAIKNACRIKRASACKTKTLHAIGVYVQKVSCRATISCSTSFTGPSTSIAFCPCVKTWRLGTLSVGLAA